MEASMGASMGASMQLLECFVVRSFCSVQCGKHSDDIFVIQFATLECHRRNEFRKKLTLTRCLRGTSTVLTQY